MPLAQAALHYIAFTPHTHAPITGPILTCLGCGAWGTRRFPASPDAAIFAAQKTLVEAHQIIQDAYVDGRFGGNDWEGELGTALGAAYRSESGEAAYGQIRHMLEKLGDPFTRIVPASCAPWPLPLQRALRTPSRCSCCSCTGLPPHGWGFPASAGACRWVCAGRQGQVRRPTVAADAP